MAAPETRSALDGLMARCIAVVVAFAAAGVVAYIHRDWLFPPEAELAPEDPYLRCIAERAAEIDKMAADGVIDDRQAALFKTRAEALCRAPGPAQ